MLKNQKRGNTSTRVRFFLGAQRVYSDLRDTPSPDSGPNVRNFYENKCAIALGCHLNHVYLLCN
jgi:hypothetical protein